MITVDYLELIEQGVDAWNQWRSKHPEESPNLESAYLFEKPLQGINLSNANLSRACLIGANLEDADLNGANLSGVYANNANLQRANLAAAELQDGNFIDANLDQANLSGAVTDNANFANARLQGTVLEGWPAVAAQSSVPVAAPVTFRRLPPVTQVAHTLPMPQRALKPNVLPRLAVGAIALVIPTLYLTLRPRPPKFVTPDGTVTIQLVCNEPDVTPLNADQPDHTYQNGTQFYGKFGDGKPANGRGSMLYANGNRYDGEYRDGQRNGCGTFTFTNGRRYVGEFDDDLFSGRGMWILENGDRYIGDFEFNKCNGEGVFIFADGTSKSGIWQQGRLVDGDLTCDRTPIDLPDS
ncbi:MAG: pentapeptide repeat-containing protein [Cyanobacteria bacterium P01_F01_bin.13]